jgi:hypothetical protein
MPSPATVPTPPSAHSTTRRGQPELRVVTLSDLLAHPFPRRTHLLHPWLRQDESALLWAPTGLGKLCSC